MQEIQSFKRLSITETFLNNCIFRFIYFSPPSLLQFGEGYRKSEFVCFTYLDLFNRIFFPTPYRQGPTKAILLREELLQNFRFTDHIMNSLDKFIIWFLINLQVSFFPQLPDASSLEFDMSI